MKTKLIPPDKKRCQAIKLGGCRPSAEAMFIIGPRTETRCSNKPSVIIFENKPASDGQKGSMSLCSECLKVFKAKMPKDFATIKPLKSES